MTYSLHLTLSEVTDETGLAVLGPNDISVAALDDGNDLEALKAQFDKAIDSWQHIDAR